MTVVRNLVGQQFGWLFVIRRAKRIGNGRRQTRAGYAYWHCICTRCGRRKAISSKLLTSGHTRSCGCLPRGTRTHGLSHTRAYRSYCAAKQRCNNPNAQGYANWGGRGIEFRITSVEQLYAHLGERPEGHSLHRIKNDAHYEIGNVCWATPREQANNRRSPKRKRRSALVDILRYKSALERAAAPAASAESGGP
jgi:hypothetical protein